MLYVFRLISPALPCGTPASHLDGDEWTFNDLTLESATKRAHRRLDSTFSLATRARVEATSLHHVATFTDQSAYKKARERAYESGVSLADVVLAEMLDADLKKAVSS